MPNIRFMPDMPIMEVGHEGRVNESLALTQHVCPTNTYMPISRHGHKGHEWMIEHT
jgi:hypothetical protein